MLTFKENLRFFRKSNKLTQSAFALVLNEQLASMNLSISYNNKSISMWEKGERLPDSPLVWLAIADVMGITVDVLMRGDITSAGMTSTVTLPEHSFNSMQLSLAEGYMSRVSNMTADRESVFALYSNIDAVNDDGTAHGMACFVSSVKSQNGGYYSHYNLLSNSESIDYIDGLSKTVFIDELSFVHDIIAHGGNDVIATTEQIDGVWRGFFDSLYISRGYNIEVLYDGDCDHILTIVEYELALSESEIADYLGYEFGKFTPDKNEVAKGAVGKLLMANNKLGIGIRYAREKWRA